jgi:DNA-binding PadR family transcriptional regulator
LEENNLVDVREENQSKIGGGNTKKYYKVNKNGKEVLHSTIVDYQGVIRLANIREQDFEDNIGNKQDFKETSGVQLENVSNALNSAYQDHFQNVMSTLISEILHVQFSTLEYEKVLKSLNSRMENDHFQKALNPLQLAYQEHYHKVLDAFKLDIVREEKPDLNIDYHGLLRSIFQNGMKLATDEYITHRVGDAQDRIKLDFQDLHNKILHALQLGIRTNFKKIVLKHISYGFMYEKFKYVSHINFQRIKRLLDDYKHGINYAIVIDFALQEHYHKVLKLATEDQYLELVDIHGDLSRTCNNLTGKIHILFEEVFLEKFKPLEFDKEYYQNNILDSLSKTSEKNYQKVLCDLQFEIWEELIQKVLPTLQIAYTEHYQKVNRGLKRIVNKEQYNSLNVDLQKLVQLICQEDAGILITDNRYQNMNDLVIFENKAHNLDIDAQEGIKLAYQDLHNKILYALQFGIRTKIKQIVLSCISYGFTDKKFKDRYNKYYLQEVNTILNFDVFLVNFEDISLFAFYEHYHQVLKLVTKGGQYLDIDILEIKEVLNSAHGTLLTKIWNNSAWNKLKFIGIEGERLKKVILDSLMEGDKEHLKKVIHDLQFEIWEELIQEVLPDLLLEYKKHYQKVIHDLQPVISKEQKEAFDIDIQKVLHSIQSVSIL